MVIVPTAFAAFGGTFIHATQLAVAICLRCSSFGHKVDFG